MSELINCTCPECGNKTLCLQLVPDYLYGAVARYTCSCGFDSFKMETIYSNKTIMPNEERSIKREIY